MKTIKIAFAVLTAFFITSSGFAQSPANKASSANENKPAVSVYYFHFNARCATCRAIESEAQLNVQLLFGDEVTFAAYNLDEPAGEAKGKELGVNGQTLLVVKDDKRINLTNEGFLYARTNPEKFKEILQEKIKPLL